MRDLCTYKTLQCREARCYFLVFLGPSTGWLGYVIDCGTEMLSCQTRASKRRLNRSSRYVTFEDQPARDYFDRPRMAPNSTASHSTASHFNHAQQHSPRPSLPPERPAHNATLTIPPPTPCLRTGYSPPPRPSTDQRPRRLSSPPCSTVR